MIAIGIAVIYWHRDLYKIFGDFERAEKAFGDSVAVYPLAGCLLIVLGILMMFGIGAGSSTSIDAAF